MIVAERRRSTPELLLGALHLVQGIGGAGLLATMGAVAPVGWIAQTRCEVLLAEGETLASNGVGALRGTCWLLVPGQSAAAQAADRRG